MVGMATRKRAIPFEGFNGKIVTTLPTGLKQTFVGGHSPTNLQGSQVTDSEDHPEWWKRIVDDPLSDVGGGFFTQKRYARAIPGSIHNVTVKVTSIHGEVTSSRYTGGCYCHGLPSATFPSPIVSGDSTLDAWGSKAIAICKPTNSPLDVSIFLGELFKEGVPKLIGSTLWRDRTQAALKGNTKRAGEEYLSYEFGWKPIANDIAKFINGVARAAAVLKQYQRDSGRVVRRRYDFPPEESFSETLFASGQRAFMNPSTQIHYDDLEAVGKVFRQRRTWRKRWFSGAFTYYIPTFESAVIDRYSQQVQHMLGLELTPELIWNLAPWTWAADWVSSLGSVVSNVTDLATDGLVLRYGYVMEHSMISDTYTFAGRTGLRSKMQPSDIILVTETKVRRKATPFGFGLTWSGLSPRQLAISAALGITRG